MNQELLTQLAAAAGLTVTRTAPGDGDYPCVYLSGHAWDPSTSDGDALRLAVKAGLFIRPGGVALYQRLFQEGLLAEKWPTDAARAAIVGAILELAKGIDLDQPVGDGKPGVEQLRSDFSTKHRAAEKAAHALACELDVGPERTRAFDVYENIRNATRA